MAVSTDRVDGTIVSHELGWLVQVSSETLA